jgi:lysophospholipase L1-like esterase
MTLVWAADIGRTSSGLVSGWNDETAIGIVNTGGTAYNQTGSTYKQLGVRNPCPEAVARRVRYTVGASQSFDLPGCTVGVPHLLRIHHWGSGADITADWTQDITLDGALVADDLRIQTAIDASDTIREVFFTPSATTVSLVLTKVSTAAIVSGLELYKNPVNPSPKLPNFGGYGDSIMWGSDATDQYHKNPTYQTWELLPNASITHFNAGVPGWRFDNLLTDLDTYVTPHYVSGVTNVLFVNGGVNDFFSGHSLATTKSDMRALCAAARSAGWLVAICTALHCSASYATPPADVPAFNANIDSLNTDIKTNWASFADAVADFTSNATLMDPDGILINDGLHPNDAGYAVMAGIMKPIVNTLAGV